MEDAISFNFMSPKFERIRSRTGLALLAGFTCAGCVVSGVLLKALHNGLMLASGDPKNDGSDGCGMGAILKFCVAVLMREPHKGKHLHPERKK